MYAPQLPMGQTIDATLKVPNTFVSLTIQLGHRCVLTNLRCARMNSNLVFLQDGQSIVMVEYCGVVVLQTVGVSGEQDRFVLTELSGSISPHPTWRGFSVGGHECLLIPTENYVC